MFGFTTGRLFTVHFSYIFMAKNKTQSFISNLQMNIVVGRKKEIKFCLRDWAVSSRKLIFTILLNLNIFLGTKLANINFSCFKICNAYWKKQNASHSMNFKSSITIKALRFTVYDTLKNVFNFMKSYLDKQNANNSGEQLLQYIGTDYCRCCLGLHIRVFII